MEITVMEASGEQDEQKNDDLVLLQQDNNERRLSKILQTGHCNVDRHIVTIDEKYLRHCLELIYLTAAASSSHLSSWDSPMMMKMFSYDLQRPSGELILGSITRGRGILNILNKSPLVHDKYVPPAIESPSTRSTYSDRSSFVSGESTAAGILHVTWELGSPRFEFSVDDRKEAAYVAELVRLRPEESTDCVYVFRGNQSEIAGRMRVSTSVVTVGLKETEFVLFGTAGAGADDDDTITRSKRVSRLKGFPGKFVEAFKRGTETNQDSGGGWYSRRRRVDLSERHFIANLELAAIVISERVSDHHPEEEKSGWGMKFLKNAKRKERNGTNVDIVVASGGVHGGPKGGPSGLIQRWRSLGQCDCGGWDVGCPFRVLKTRANYRNGSSSSFDLFIEGSSEVALSMMKMESASSYLVRMESGISVLQSFAIAVSIIHSRLGLQLIQR